MTLARLAKVINFITRPINHVSAALLIVILVQVLLIASNVYQTILFSLQSVIAHRIAEQIRHFHSPQRNVNV